MSFNFKGEKYITILEIEQILLIEKKLLEMYKIQLKGNILKGVKDNDELQSKINIQNTVIKKMADIESKLLDDVDLISSKLNDIPAQVFLRKFIIGLSDNEIMSELAISRATLFRNYTKIKEAMLESAEGLDIYGILNNL